MTRSSTENEPTTRSATHRYGPVSFVSALVSVLVAEFAAWIAALSYLMPLFYYVLPALLVVDMIAYAVLAKRPGTWGQVGRGILIGSISVPVSLIVFTAVYLVAQAIGPI